MLQIEQFVCYHEAYLMKPIQSRIMPVAIFLFKPTIQVSVTILMTVGRILIGISNYTDYPTDTT